MVSECLHDFGSFVVLVLHFHIRTTTCKNGRSALIIIIIIIIIISYRRKHYSGSRFHFWVHIFFSFLQLA